MAVLGIERDPQTGRVVLPTEVAATAFGLLMGVGGGVAQLIAGRRLSGVSGDTIGLRNFSIPLLAATVGAIGGAFLIPSS